MAVTTVRKQEEVAKSSGVSTPYSGMKGLSDTTKTNLGNYQAGYKPSETVQQAKQNMDAIQAQKPQGFNSKYGAQLDSIMEQLMNPGEFKYSINGDELFKSMADLYSEKARQGSMDAMGQAAALTGGYGSSYGQQVAGQTYQQNMLPLYEMIPEYYNMARQGYQDKLNLKKDQLSALQAREDTEYGRYRDEVGDWEKERDYATGRYDTERGYDVDDYYNMLNYWTQMAGQENSAYETEQARLEKARQFDAEMAEQQRQSALDEAYRRDALNAETESDKRNLAYKYAMAALENGQLPSTELLAQAGLSEADARAMMAQMVPAEQLDALKAQMMAGGGGGAGIAPVINMVDRTPSYGLTGGAGSGSSGGNDTGISNLVIGGLTALAGDKQEKYNVIKDTYAQAEKLRKNQTVKKKDAGSGGV